MKRTLNTSATSNNDKLESSSKKSKTINGDKNNDTKEDLFAINQFRDYLKIDTISPTLDYSAPLNFLEKYLEHWSLPKLQRLSTDQGHGIGLVTIAGSEPSLPSILLVSHMDVVPVDLDKWNVPPFEGYMNEEGKIYGRGAQDMKCVTIQHIEAVGRLFANGQNQLKRSIHLLFLPEEEVGGAGMIWFVKSDWWTKLNVGLSLDEGLASPNSTMNIYYGERSPAWFKVTAKGPTGHGSRFVKGTAMMKLYHVIDGLLKFRNENESKLEAKGSCLTLGDVTTVNLTAVKAGVPRGEERDENGQPTEFAVNVIPTKAEAWFDVRVTPEFGVAKFIELVESLTQAHPDLTYEYLHGKPLNSPPSDLGSKFYEIVTSTFSSEFGLKTEPRLFPAASDSRFIRALGVPALGISPMNNTPVLLHDHNEFLHKDVLVAGIPIFMSIIRNLGNSSEWK